MARKRNIKRKQAALKRKALIASNLNGLASTAARLVTLSPLKREALLDGARQIKGKTNTVFNGMNAARANVGQRKLSVDMMGNSSTIVGRQKSKASSPRGKIIQNTGDYTFQGKAIKGYAHLENENDDVSKYIQNPDTSLDHILDDMGYAVNKVYGKG